jgi:hypothetical protein
VLTTLRKEKKKWLHKNGPDDDIQDGTGSEIGFLPLPFSSCFLFSFAERGRIVSRAYYSGNPNLDVS